MARLSKFTVRDRALMGDSKPGHRPFAWRREDQDRGADRCAGYPRQLPLAARSEERADRGVGFDQGAENWSPFGGQSL